MRVILLALFSSIIVLMSCNCNFSQVPPPISLPEQQMQGGVSEREHLRQLTTYFTERTVSVLRDCSAKKGIVFFDINNPNRILDGRGTGVIVKSKETRSYIYTEAHVVVLEDKYKKGFICNIYINRNDNLGNKNTRMKVEILSFDSDRDIAILKIDKNLGISTKLETAPFVGEKVWAVGYPTQLISRKTKRLSITEGTLATLKVPASNNTDIAGYYHRVTSQIYFGNSGGGIWNINGKLVGTAAAMYTKNGVPYEGYYYIKPIGEYETLLKDSWKYWEIFDI